MNDTAGICASVGCGHPYSAHSPFNDTQICGECARPWEGLGVGVEYGYVVLGLHNGGKTNG